MKKPVQITFRNMEVSPALEAKIEEKSEKLTQYFNQIIGCRVIVESDHKRHHHGNLYHVRIDITVPGKEIVVSRSPTKHHAHEDAYVAVRDAFDAAKKQLQHYHAQLKGHVKTHFVNIPEYTSDATLAV